MQSDNFSQFFEFFKTAEKLKTELRHSWTNNSKRKESVAEHVWMMTLMVLIFSDKIDHEIDKLKALKMAIIHDLGESVAGDVPSHEISNRQNNKNLTETEGFKKLVSKLDSETKQELLNLWNEFEEMKTPEAKFVYALDKFECLFQHNIADIKTWDEGDYRYTFVDVQDTPFDSDEYLRQLKNYLDDWTFEKLTKAGTVSRVPVKNLKRYKNN